MLQIGPLTIDFTPLLAAAAVSPLNGAWYIFTHGAWIVIVLTLLTGLKWWWLFHIAVKASDKWKWVLLAIDIPAENIQGPKAVENVLAHLAGAHDKPDLIQKYITGFSQPHFSLEIVSIEGFVQFYIRTTTKTRDLAEASIFAQYPSAEITEVPDYATWIPDYYPNPEWQLYGTEFKLVKDQAYPIRTYEAFHDETAEEATFKDPMAAFLETMSSLGPGEHAALQILVTPIASHSWQAGSYKLIEKLAGIPSHEKKSWLGKIFEIPGLLIAEIAKGFLGGEAEGESHTKEELPSKMLYLTSGEREVIEAIEEKAAKIGFHTKIRSIYVGRHDVFNKPKAAWGIVGAMKQLNTEDLNALKIDTKKIGVHAHYLFKEQRKNWKRRKIIRAFKNRSNWRGHEGYVLNIEELATIWHFPIAESVKAPLIKKAESKRGEPPHGLPMGGVHGHGGPPVGHGGGGAHGTAPVALPVDEEAPDDLPM